MALPKFLQTYLASYDLSGLDTERDKELIITEILNKGDEKALRWLTKTYSKSDVKKIISSPIRGMWFKSTLGYWLRIFGLELAPKDFEKSVINLNA